ncbi:MAG: fructose PTS transporter subunit IIA [Clostridium sp.]|jgi:nitrogen PTS system EIIA component|uniref:PTS sugar transporter subunit IIA n=1 Tax=Clostridium TaxID=1485 RepID=UPI00290453B3|nr:fructose PTS transporter subunit IIA [Clostridium sp.]MDU2157333.1 fructose PTS transporter subunit IIA [Clostridium sp.]MDU7147313.1 fructose PTS transporter subunit IIA [Clostridium sp.]
MELKDLIKESTIKLQLDAKDKNSVLDEMIKLLVDDDVVTDKNKFKEDILAREELSNTGIGFEIAIPHAKSKAVKEARIAIGITNNGIDYGSIDGQDIKMIFMIAVSEDQSDLHLKALANLSRKLMHDEFRESILNAKTEKEIIDML